MQPEAPPECNLDCAQALKAKKREICAVDGVSGIAERGTSMFRPMRRIKQQLSQEECEQVLTSERRGVLSVHGEDGYPYGVPMDYLYEQGKIYFHGAKVGHKIDAIKADNRVSFTVFDQGVPVEGKVGPNVRSVIVFGRISLLETTPETLEIARRLGEKYDPSGYVEDELRRTAERIQLLELAIDHMTGKRVNES
jgi:nitroimidazol reductase NimA-like FMN-containing flavoprotein (pyridoxamine 5'-phosphate oxidase superfamily)